MAQPSYYATGTTPNINDPELKRWTRILGVYQNRAGAKASNNPLPTDTVRQIKKKVLSAIGTSTGGGGGGGPTDPDVIAFVACSGITDPTQIGAVTALVTSLKSNNLWNSFDAIYPFVGGNAAAHSCNLRNPGTFSITWHGGLTHNSNGVTGNGSTGFGDTGFNPSTASGNFSINAGALGVYCKTAAPADGYFIGAHSAPGNSFTAILSLSTGTLLEIGGFGIDNQFTLATAGMKGSVIGVRNSASSMTAYATDGSSTNTSYTVVNLVNNNLYVLGENQDGSLNGPSNANLAFAFIAGAFNGSQVTALQSIILTYETTLNRQ